MKELTRPTIYRVMKYWGKKPHNIWNSYIKKYSKKGDIILDPFVGSGMTYFESIKCNRIPLTIDLNPISDLSIKCLTYRNVEYKDIVNEMEKVINKVTKLECYTNEYECKCSKCNLVTKIYNYKVNGCVTRSYKCDNCGETITEEVFNENKNYKIDKWVPSKKLSDIKSVSDGFIKKVGGNNIANLWTNRNLKILSEIYSEILLIKDVKIKDIMVFAFIQCVHLTSKMCIPRSDKSKRPLSTSWGRPAYIISDKIFEQNPIIAFEKAVSNSTGVIKGIKSSEEYLGKKINEKAHHYLGDSLSILKTFPSKSIDMAITDPPYGNIIQYGDLSEVWVSWLEHYKPEYTIEHEKEVIVNKNKAQFNYRTMLENIFCEVNRVLKDESYFVLTFNSNNNEDWQSLFQSLKNSNFCIKNVKKKKNRRSSEANVTAKDGIAISDYYFICTKGNWVDTNILNIITERSIELK